MLQGLEHDQAIFMLSHDGLLWPCKGSNRSAPSWPARDTFPTEIIMSQSIRRLRDVQEAFDLTPPPLEKSQMISVGQVSLAGQLAADRFEPLHGHSNLS